MENLKTELTVWELPKELKSLNIKFDLQNPENEDEKTIKDEYYKIVSEPYSWEDSRIVFIGKKLEPFSSHSFPFLKNKTLVGNDFIFLKDLFEVMKNTPQHLYNFIINNPFDVLKENPEYNTLDNIIVGLKVKDAGLERFNDFSTKRKYLYFDALTNIVNDIDFSKYKFEFVMVDFSEKAKLSEEEIKDLSTLKQKCDDFNIPLDFKTWGRKNSNPNPNDLTTNSAYRYYDKAGRMLDGKIYHYDPILKTTAPTINLFGNGYYVMDDFKGYQSIWELKSYLPMMQDELYQSLKEDIRTNGLIDPILYYVINDGTKLIIEGHTRLKACIELNLQDFPTKEIEENFYSLEDIKLWMLKHQFQRRNLSNVEKLELAYLSKDIIEKQAKENLRRAGKGDSIDSTFDTNAEIANLAGVGRSIVVNYGAVLKKDPSLIDKMKSGELSISAAYKKVKDKPSNIKIAFVNPEIKYLNSLDEGKDLMSKGTIEGIVILDDKNKIDILTNAQKSKLGVFLI